MTTVDERIVAAPPDVCFSVASDVERWPDILPHYRLVKMHARYATGAGRVEMSAWRDFAGPLRYPTWWLSDMRLAPDEPAIYFVHVQGITRRMDVKWSFDAHPAGAHVRITHAWDGPRWPLIGAFAWKRVIGPHFVSFIAERTLAGVAREAERRARSSMARNVANAESTDA
ncbi:MAG TPA: SRPBCC family protein [Longimicrobiales bacterium]|nr:SRPBCC family protein [Longimicrobiales bacterium]